MNTTLFTPTAEAKQPGAVTLPAAPASRKQRSRRRSLDVDSLLRSGDAGHEGVTAMEAEPGVHVGPGFAVALRFALLFNAGLLLLGVLGYEGWALLAK